jgi:hypothetical protein
MLMIPSSDYDLVKDACMKLILCLGEQTIGINIIFHKSKIVCFQIKEHELEKTQLLGCRLGQFYFKYLIFHIDYCMSHN